MKRYADGGGRIFADHLHSDWIRTGLPPWPATANWVGVGPTCPAPSPPRVDTTFPKGMALADWLVTRRRVDDARADLARDGAALGRRRQSRRDAALDLGPQNATTARAQSTQYLTFNTPVEAPAANQCGRVVFTDVHVARGRGDSLAPGRSPFPIGLHGVDWT